MARLSPEHSAQANRAPPNPCVAHGVAALRQITAKKRLRIADQGCGKLRHLSLLARASRELVLVETPDQLDSTHIENGRPLRIRDLVRVESARRGIRMRVLAAPIFDRTKLGLDAVFNVAVLDVVPRVTREAILAAAYRNLRRDGYLVLIVPRNDATILRRCHAGNRWRDGHRFAQKSFDTFYSNFRDGRGLTKWVEARGFHLFSDHSIYRQFFAIFQRS
jgi:SAM-dependent methyltransferase